MFYNSVTLLEGPTWIEALLSERRAFVMKKCRILVEVRSHEMLLFQQFMLIVSECDEFEYWRHECVVI